MNEIADLLRVARRQGWGYRRGRHHILTSPDGLNTVVVPLTPSDWRSLRNAKNILKKAGLRV